MVATDDTNRMILRLIGLGGIANVIGGIFVAGAYLLHPPLAEPDVVASGLWLIVHAGFMVSLLGGIFALFALLGWYLRCGGGWLGVLGCAMAVTSLVFIFGLDYSEVFIFPTLATEFPEVVWKYGDGTLMPSVAFAFPLSGILFLVGYLLFSYQLMATKCISRGSASMLMIGTVAFGFGLSGFAPIIAVRIGATLFGAGLILSGLSLRERVSREAI